MVSSGMTTLAAPRRLLGERLAPGGDAAPSATRFRAMRMARLRGIPSAFRIRRDPVGLPPPPRLSSQQLARAAGVNAHAKARIGAINLRRAVTQRFRKLDWSELCSRFTTAKAAGSMGQKKCAVKGAVARAKVPTCAPVINPAVTMPVAIAAALAHIAGKRSMAQAQAAALAVPAEVLELVRAAVIAEMQTGARLLHDVPEVVLAYLKAQFPDAKLRDLARFIIACKGDPDKAEKRWQKHSAWRNTELPQMVFVDPPALDYSALDGTATEQVIAELRTGKMVVHGHDRQNRPLMVWDNGLHDPATSNTADVLPMVVYLMEAATAEMREDVHSISMLIHTSPGSFKSNLELIKGAGKLFAEQYPERLGQVLVFPVGPVSRWLWSVAAPFLPVRTREKVVLLDSATWREKIVEYVEPSQLQTRFGGHDEWSFGQEMAEARARGDGDGEAAAAKR